MLRRRLLCYYILVKGVIENYFLYSNLAICNEMNMIAVAPALMSIRATLTSGSI